MSSSSSAAESSEDHGVAIDTLRGIAILLLVALHATAEEHQPRLSTVTSPYAYLGYSTNFIRLPLFTVLSGFVYGLRPVQSPTVRQFWRGKLRRLGFPLITLTLLTLGLRAAMGRGPHGLMDVVNAFVMPFQHLWYLPALAWVFAAATVFELRGWMQTPAGWARVLAGAIAAHLFTDVMKWGWLQTFSMAGAIYLLPSFLLGLGLCRFISLRRSRHLLSAALFALVTGLAVQQLVFFELIVFDVSKTGPLSIAVGLAAGVVLLRLCSTVDALARLGRQSYPIYLLHGIGIAVGTRLVAKLGGSSAHATFFGQFFTGLVVPLIGAWFIRRVPWGRTIVLGERSSR